MIATRYRSLLAAAGLAASLAAQAQSLPPDARAGDLIFREGTEAVSNAVMAVDGGGYSHVGMLVGQPGNWQVLHATPSEVPGRPDGVVLDTLAFFTDPARSLKHTVYHVSADAQQRDDAVRRALAEQGRPFRIADPAGTYCTALVWQAWRDAGVDFDVEFTALTLPLLQGRYLLPGNLMASAQLRPLAPASIPTDTHAAAKVAAGGQATASQANSLATASTASH